MPNLIKRTSVSNSGQAAGTVIVIDVLRAFTTAAYAFTAGTQEILLVSGVQEALDLQRQFPGYLLMGEVGGLPIPGFDFSNSPFAISRADLRGKGLIQRTSAGTQGVVRSSNASRLLAASFCVAKPTARALKGYRPGEITFVITGAESKGGGDEDAACADYIEALLYQDHEPDVSPYLERVRHSTAGKIFADPLEPEFPQADLEYSLQANRFDFAMEVERLSGQFILRPRW